MADAVFTSIVPTAMMDTSHSLLARAAYLATAIGLVVSNPPGGAMEPYAAAARTIMQTTS